MSTGVRTILGVAEIIVGSYVPGAQFLVSMGVATLIGVAVEEITPSPHTATTGAAPIKTTWAATNSYGSLIYGIGRAGGVLCYLNTCDSDGVNDIRGNPIAHPAKLAILDIFVTHSVTDPALGCAGFGSIYVNDIEIPPDAITYTVGTKGADGFVAPVGGKVAGQVTAGPFAGMLEIRQYDGTQTTAVDVLPAAYGSEPDIPVDDNFIPYGLVSTHYRFYPSSDMAAFKKAFGGALPHNVMAVIKGEKIYDPRDANQSETDKSTWQWSENSALIAYDFLARAMLDGGCGFPRTIVDETSVIASANACDTVVPYGAAGGTWAADTAYTIYQRVIDPAGNVQVAYTAGTSGDTQPNWPATVGAQTNDGTVVWKCTALGVHEGPLYRCDGAIDLSKTREQALSDILASMAGALSQSSNGFPLGILSGSWSAPAGEIDESFLAGAVTIQDAKQDQRYNVVKAHYTDKDQAFNDVVAPAVPDFASADYVNYVAADGYEIDKDLDLALVNNHDNAQLVAQVKARQSRYLQSISMVCNFRALVYNVGDRVQVTNAERNWNLVNVLITKMTLQPDYTVKVEGTRDEQTCYESTVPTVGAYIVPPNHQYTAPPVPSGMTATGNPGGVLLQWTAIPAALAETIEIWRASVAGGPYVQIDSVNGAKSSYTDALAKGATGYYVIRAFNGTIYSDYSAEVSAVSQLGIAAVVATTEIPPGGTIDDPGTYKNNHTDQVVSETVDGQQVGLNAGTTHLQTFVPKTGLVKQILVHETDGSFVRFGTADDSGWGALSRTYDQGHKPNLDDDVLEGATYGRTLKSRLNSGKPLIDFSETFHLNKTQDHIADGASFRRVGSAYVDTANRINALFDPSASIVYDGATLGDGIRRARSGLDSSGNVARTVPDGQVSESSVTQHQNAINAGNTQNVGSQPAAAVQTTVQKSTRNLVTVGRVSGSGTIAGRVLLASKLK